ncbi:conjugal transfer protein TraG N-terminal domain-containing protein [Marinobacter sp. G11]|uniref:conjugal transfer protein TraG N-terminal domain-containing protein n=1 Tax=Marinobacter sp. G11 TaxID=2903522 RepID=UPI001E2D830E|nr:conjugal transfer protein TraG N-terminal domain-containing protein [Marinobacter sp. G11]MCE0759422.1 conjugal transfer protein TraG N-terminal domain-containing protein [Marinobacter sp. G11]
MEFTIFSVGDAAFLEQILIAVAMVTSPGTGFTDIVKIGLLIGVLLILVQSVFQGAKEVNIQQIFIGYLIYALFFVPTTLVKIEDAYTGDVRVVDNVPLGIGAAGGIISTIGYNITNLFEQGYGVIVPSATENRFAESLKLLNDVRKRVAATPVYAVMDATIGGDADIRKSWNNYIRECTLTAVDLGPDLGGKRLTDIMSGELPDALRFNSNLYGTRLYLGGGGTDYSCSDAYTVLVNNTNSALASPMTDNAISKILGIDTTGVGASSAISEISNSLGMLGQSSTAATDYLTAAVLEPIYYEAAQGRYTDFQDIASATMINQAIQQRNTQWAAEQSMFMTIVRPMMTFFEGFVYAITPFMAFLIVLGSFGIGLAGKYLQTLLWIQLWTPVLAIINLYLHTAAAGDLSSIEGELNSFYALNAASDQLQHWIATGGMLAAATPMISLFIVTGSTYAFSNLAGRINGRDHLDETLQSKDLATNGPVMQNAASNEYTDLTGMASTGAAGLMGSISFGSGMGKMVASSQQRMEQSQQGFSEALGSTFSSGKMDSQTYEKAAALGRTHSAMHGTSQGVVNERAQQIMENSSIGHQHADAVKGIVSAVASGSISGELGTKMLSQLAESAMVSDGGSQSSPLNPSPGSTPGSTASQNTSATRSATRTGGKAKSIGVGVGAEASLKAGADKTTTDTRTTQQDNSAAFSDALKFSKAEQSQVSNNLALALSEGNKDALSKTFGAQDSQTLTKNAQDVVSSNEAYNRAASLNENASALNNLRLRDVGNQVAGNSDAMGQLNDYWNTGGVSAATKAEAQRLYERYSAPSTEGGYGMSSSAALAAARIKALQNSSNHEGTTDDQYQRNFNAAVGAVGTGLGLATGNYGGFDQNSGLRDVDNGNLKNRANENAQNIENAVDPAKNIGSPDGLGPNYQDPTSAGDTPGVIGAEAARNNQRVGGTGSAWEAGRNAQNEMPARQQLLNNGPEYDRMSAADLYGSVENANDWVSRRMQEAEKAGQNLFNAAGEGMTAASANFDERLAALKNDPALRQQVIDATRGTQNDLEESGLAGKIMSGLSTVGQNIIGMAATGMELARGEISFSDLKDMSFEEKGMVYSAALSHAMATGGEAAARAFQESEGVQFRQEFYQEAMSRGLTHEQAQVYAHSFDMEVFGQSPERAAAIQGLAATYAERDEHGNIMRDGNGAPVLSEQNQEFVDHMVHTITESARAGSTMSGSYLSGVAHYNNMTGRGASVMN